MGSEAGRMSSRYFALRLEDIPGDQELYGFPHCAAAYLFYFTRTSNPTTSICVSLSKLKLISSAMIGSLNLMDLSH